MDTTDAQAAPGYSNSGGEMTPSTDELDVNAWRRIDDVQSPHQIVIWMIILELEREGAYPINGTTIYQRMLRWWGEYQNKDRVDRSVRRLDEYGLIERDEVEEHRGGIHNSTTTDGYEIARQHALKWLDVLECEDREDLHEIDPEAEAATDGGEDE